MQLVDCQTHVFSPEFADILARNEGEVRSESREDSLVVHFGTAQSLVIKPVDYSPERKLADMDRTGVAVSILSPNIPGPEDLEEKLREPAARACNDYTAELCRKHPTRFKGLAALPFTTIEAVMAEYGRSIHELGLSGVMLLSHLGGRNVEDRYWDPLYRAAEAEAIPLVIHPTVPTWGEAIREYSMIPMVGLMVDHSFAMLRLILGGTLERFPALKIVHPHCGGVLPYVMPRIDEQTEVKRRGRDNISKPPSEYYRDIYLDIVSPSHKTARFALEFAGADRLVFGSDHPWVKIEAMLDVFGKMGLNDEEREKIGYKNAARLFRLPSLER